MQLIKQKENKMFWVHKSWESEFYLLAFLFVSHQQVLANLLGIATTCKLQSDVDMAHDRNWGYLHLVQLFIDFLIIFIVFTKLGDQRPVSQSEQLRVLQERKEQNSHITCAV